MLLLHEKNHNFYLCLAFFCAQSSIKSKVKNIFQNFNFTFLSWCKEDMVQNSASQDKDWQTSSNLSKITQNWNFQHFFVRDPTKIANFKLG